MDKNTVVILNKQHNLFPEQEKLLRDRGSWEVITVPASGWTLTEQDAKVQTLTAHSDNYLTVVFASPIPYMLKALAAISAVSENLDVVVFHNDHREKKELPNGKIISVTAKTGWQLV